MDIEFSIATIRLIESHFKLNTEFSFKKKEGIVIDSKIAVMHKINNKNVSVLLSISSTNDDVPFIFNTTYEGEFKFKKVPGKDKLDRIAHINLAAIVFPYARETLAELTRKSGVPPFHVGPINFVELYEHAIKDRQSVKTKA